MNIKSVARKIFSGLVFWEKTKITTKPLKPQKLSIKSELFDEQTKTILTQVKDGTLSYGVTGLINLKSGELYFGGAVAHDNLAQQRNLKENDKALKNDWYGFNIIYKSEESLFQVSPMSGQFGGIPIEYRETFENFIKDLFGTDVNKILFFQFNYKRGISDSELRSIVSFHPGELLVAKSLSDEELRRLN
jgi:hypothetical protein